MMTLEHSAEKAFFGLLESLWETVQVDPLVKLRGAAWDKFRELGLPSSRQEIFRHVSLRKFLQKRYSAAYPTPLTREAIAPHILPECQKSVVVFVNGYFEPSLSSIEALPQLGLAPLGVAFKSYATFLSNQWQRTLEHESDAWSCINASLHPSGAFIYVPPRVQLGKPLQVLSIVDAQDQPMLLLPRWHLYLGSQGSVEIIVRHVALSGQSYALFPACDLSLDEGARLSLTQMAVIEHEDAWHAESVRALLKRDSSFKSVLFAQGGEALRHDYRINLVGENSSAELSGLALMRGHSEAHVHSYIDHIAPNCQSLQLFKNVLTQSSHSSFEGKIDVHSEAQKTNAFQLNNNLILSDGAQAYSKPNLEIRADDVKASHGSTTGQLDTEQLFYLLARGLNRTQANSILLHGFCRAVLDKLKIPSIASEVQRFVSHYTPAD